MVLSTLLLPACFFGFLAWRYSQPGPATEGIPFWPWADTLLLQWPSVSVVLGLLVIMMGGLLVSLIYNEHDYAHKENYLPGLVYFLFGVSSSDWVFLNPVFLANIFVLLALRSVLRSGRVKKANTMLYNAGLFLGIASLFYPPYIILILFVWIAMSIMRSTTLREVLLSIMGLLTVGAYVFSLYWWKGTEPDLSGFFDFGESMDAESSACAFFCHWHFLVLTILVALAGWAIFLKGLSGSTVHRKNAKRVFNWLSLFLIVLVGYQANLQQQAGSYGAALAIPFSVFCAVLFAEERRKPWIDLAFHLWVLPALYVASAVLFAG